MDRLNLAFLAGSLLLAFSPFAAETPSLRQQANADTGQVKKTVRAEFRMENPGYRVDCDDFATVRPSDEAYWEKLAGCSVSLTQAIELAKATLQNDKHRNEEVRVLSAKLVLYGAEHYEIEAMGRKTSESGEEVVTRWRLRVGTQRARVKHVRRLERLPGTPVRGEHGVITLPTGVMIHDVRLGDGAEVKEDSTVRCHYTMTTLDGVLVFDTYDTREPLVFDMTEPPIEGLAYGLLGARAGGKRKVVIPPGLAFKNEGLGDLVPPFATVVYDIEVLGSR